ncbi:MAG: efflux RND transporter permease subunit [Candidatus Nitrospinota bacterium M3_3B_026]
MGWVTEYSVRNHVAVYALAVIITVTGLYSYITLPREASPDITIPFVIVTTTYTGVSPSDVETLITREIEKELKNIENIKEMRSSSREGLSAITVEFDPSEDIDNAVQKVRDKVSVAKPKLPADADEPQVMEINFSNIPIMIVNVSGAYGLPRLKRAAEDLQEKIEQVPGVLDVGLVGGIEREVQVDADPERLSYYGVSLDDVADVIARENVTIPGGSMDIGRYKYLLRAPGQFEDPGLISGLAVRSSGHNAVYVRDLADVRFGFKESSSYARLNGVDCVSLTVTKRAGENIIEVSDAVKELVERELPLLPRGTDIKITADQSEMTRTLIDDLENNILSGLVLVLGVIFFFLGLRVAVFVALSIPFSLLISFFVLSALGFSLNMVVLFSLILALGMLVDNAVVIVENIYRHAEEGAPPVRAAVEGTAEVAAPVAASTVTTLCAFLPIMFWPGIMGEFMVYLPYTLTITLSASLFVALVINPTLCATMLRVKAHGRKMDEFADEELGPLMRLYKGLLVFSLRRRGATFAAAALTLAIVAAVYARMGLGVEFFPTVEPSKIFIDIETPTGTNVDTTDAVARSLEKIVEKAPDLETYVTNVGVSTGQFDFAGPGEGGPSHKSRIAVDFLDREDRSQSTELTQDWIRGEAAWIVGAKVSIEPERMGPPTGPPVNIEISGDEYDILADLSREMESLIAGVPGVVDMENDYSVGRPELTIRIDRERAASYGFSTRDVAGDLRRAVYGTIAGVYRQGKDEYDIRVRLKERSRDSIEDLEELFIKKDGKSVPLSSVAKITTASGYSDIRHIDQRRVVTVSSKVASSYNANAVLENVKRAVGSEISVPNGYRVAYTGQNKEQREAEDFLSKAFVGALLLIAFVLIFQFNSFSTPLIILSSVILSMIGVLIGLMATGTPFGVIMTGVGVISLAGVVVNNSIVLLDYTIQLRRRGLPKTTAVITAGMTRLRPVLLTAITTILGLAPMATGVSFDFKDLEWVIGSDSADWWGPMAVAVVFGLGFATVLTLVVTPALYSLLDSLVARGAGAPLTTNGAAPGDLEGDKA